MPFVQRNALIASRPARRATADGYADFKPPDDELPDREETFEPTLSSLMPVPVEESI
jgi:hypothetical protein